MVVHSSPTSGVVFSPSLLATQIRSLMTNGEFISQAAKTVECRTHSVVGCESCLEEAAVAIGVVAWNATLLVSDSLDDAFQELNMVRDV